MGRAPGAFAFRGPPTLWYVRILTSSERSNDMWSNDMWSNDMWTNDMAETRHGR
jgi:hypothetical protein